MLTHDERLACARSAVDYITGRTADEQLRPVPNCPGWTVYNAAAHIGRVAIAWESMIGATPDDPASRTRGYAESERRPAGASTADLASWANSALDQLEADTDRSCYFSMTGGEGTVGLWGWHAASELGVHRLDVELALGHPHSLDERQAGDAIAYTAQYFLPAMRRAVGVDPGRLEFSIAAAGDGETAGPVVIESDGEGSVRVGGPPVQLLLAMWGRPHDGVRVLEGDAAVWDQWRALPTEAFQFGTWD